MERNLRKKREGLVTSDKMNKTIVVKTEFKERHPVYNKVIRKHVSFKAHDENNEAREGDRVLIMETRPLSKDKRWRLVKVLEKAKGKEIGL